MDKNKLFPKTHIWLILPFIVVICGFYFSYWSKFLDVPFRQHIHGLTATCWFILVIVQPYLYQKGNIRLHRKIGLIGLFLAGGVVFSMLQMLPFILSSGIPSDIAYGILFLDFIALGGFSFSIWMGIRNVKNIRIHGRWMVATVIWSFQPAVIRLIDFSIRKTTNGNSPFNFTELVYISNAIIFLAIIIIMLDDYRKEKVIYSSYMVICITVILMSTLYSYITKASWWGYFLESVLKS